MTVIAVLILNQIENGKMCRWKKSVLLLLLLVLKSQYSDGHHDALVFSSCCSVQWFILILVPGSRKEFEGKRESRNKWPENVPLLSPPLLQQTSVPPPRFTERTRSRHTISFWTCNCALLLTAAWFPYRSLSATNAGTDSHAAYFFNQSKQFWSTTFPTGRVHFCSGGLSAHTAVLPSAQTKSPRITTLLFQVGEEVWCPSKAVNLAVFFGVFFVFCFFCFLFFLHIQP